jgi:hypothetical protein
VIAAVLYTVAALLWPGYEVCVMLLTAAAGAGAAAATAATAGRLLLPVGSQPSPAHIQHTHHRMQRVQPASRGPGRYSTVLALQQSLQ